MIKQLFALSALSLSIVACGGGGGAPSSGSNTAQSSKGGLVGSPAPEFELPGLDGSTVRLSNYRGKVVLLNFWYTGCAPCREETPALQAANRELAGQGLQIIGVNVRLNERAGPDGEADIRKFVDEFGVTYPIALDVESKADRAYQIYVLPTSVMIDRDGQIRYLMFSAVTTRDVEALFKKLQQET